MTGRVVVSAPRSGINWLRFWIEDSYGLSTGGEGVARGATGQVPCIARSHDPLGLRPVRFWRRETRSRAWTRLDPAAAAGGRVLLILRNPLEVFVRAAGGSRSKFLCYASCIRFLTEARGAQRLVVHYEDLIAKPETMAQALAFLALEPAPGFTAPDVAQIAAGWADAGRRSRENYSSRHSSGTKTAWNPLDFTFHSRALSAAKAQRVWADLDAALDAEGRALLDRYR